MEDKIKNFEEFEHTHAQMKKKKRIIQSDFLFGVSGGQILQTEAF